MRSDNQLVELPEDRDHIGCDVPVHDQLAAVGLPVEAEVVHLDPAEKVGADRAAGPPAGTEFGDGDWVDGRGRRRRRRRTGVVVVVVITDDDDGIAGCCSGGFPRHCSSAALAAVSTASVATDR